MANYRIYKSEEFEKDINCLDNSLRLQIDQELRQLELNPYVGKPLSFRFLREKKVRNYRFYYLIYDEYVVVFVVAISDKKNQQAVINKIKSKMNFYKEEIKNKITTRIF